jgi:hypothetical protein
VLSSLALLAATVHEVLDGVRDRVFPGLVVLLVAGLSGVFVTGDVFDFYVFFEAVDDGRVHPRDVRRHPPGARRGARLHDGEPARARFSSCSRSPASTTSPARWT